VLALLFFKNREPEHSELKGFYFIETLKAGNPKIACLIFSG